MQVKWSYWTATTLVLTLMWYVLFGVTRFLQNDFPLTYTGVFYLGIMFIRTILTWEYYKIMAEEENVYHIQILDDEMQQLSDTVRTIKQICQNVLKAFQNALNSFLKKLHICVYFRTTNNHTSYK